MRNAATPRRRRRSYLASGQVDSEGQGSRLAATRSWERSSAEQHSGWPDSDLHESCRPRRSAAAREQALAWPARPGPRVVGTRRGAAKCRARRRRRCANAAAEAQAPRRGRGQSGFAGGHPTGHSRRSLPDQFLEADRARILILSNAPELRYSVAAEWPALRELLSGGWT